MYPGLEVIKKFMLNSTEHKISIAHNTKMLKIKTFLAFKILSVVFIILINNTNNTMSMIKFMLS